MYMSYFLQQEYGEDFYLRADEVVDLSKKQRTMDKIITDCFEQVVYSINQPTGARNFQAVFWNISYYDNLWRFPLPRRQKTFLGRAELVAKALYALV